MTHRDELRAKAIEAMAMAMAISDGFRFWKEITLGLREKYFRQAAAAFDAQNGIVRVVPMKATEEMLERYLKDQTYVQLGNYAKGTFLIMTAAGDLTDEPQK